MGTRADYYIGTDEKAEWLGSTAYDGYPEGVPQDLVKATTKEQFIEELNKIFAEQAHATKPEHGWPWPWEDSRTTDFAYAWDDANHAVMVSRFGRPYMPVTEYLAMDEAASDAYYAIGHTQVFPDMKDRQNVTLGPRSGMLV